MVIGEARAAEEADQTGNRTARERKQRSDLFVRQVPPLARAREETFGFRGGAERDANMPPEQRHGTKRVPLDQVHVGGDSHSA